jgi:hypothetical protein
MASFTIDTTNRPPISSFRMHGEEVIGWPPVAMRPGERWASKFISFEDNFLPLSALENTTAGRHHAAAALLNKVDTSAHHAMTAALTKTDVVRDESMRPLLQASEVPLSPNAPNRRLAPILIPASGQRIELQV